MGPTNRTYNRFERPVTTSGFALGSGLGVRAEIGAFVWRGLSIGIAGHFQPYLGNTADSNANATINPICQDSQGNPSPCFGTTSKGPVGLYDPGQTPVPVPIPGKARQFV